jgi:catechol 2,3-dioxygenase-like lactoylglutathione lyase family enzyme
VTSGVRWMFHATAMGASYDAILDPLASLLGCRVLHDNEVPTPGIERRGGMTWIADNSIEIGQPLNSSSPVQRFVDRFGGGMHSIAVQVEDLDAALARAEGAGVRVASRIDEGLAFTRPGDTAGLLVEWYSKRQHDDPRWGAPEPPFVREPVVKPTRVAFVGAIVDDPVSTAWHLGEVFDTDVSILAVDGPASLPRATVALGDCVLALYPIPSSPLESEHVWGHAYDRARCLALGLTVEDLAAAEQALAGAGVGVHRRAGDGSVVLDPTALPFPVLLTETLLPGDPRI